MTAVSLSVAKTRDKLEMLVAIVNGFERLDGEGDELLSLLARSECADHVVVKKGVYDTEEEVYMVVDKVEANLHEVANVLE